MPLIRMYIASQILLERTKPIKTIGTNIKNVKGQRKMYRNHLIREFKLGFSVDERQPFQLVELRRPLVLASCTRWRRIGRRGSWVALDKPKWALSQLVTCQWNDRLSLIYQLLILSQSLEDKRSYSLASERSKKLQMIHQWQTEKSAELWYSSWAHEGTVIWAPSRRSKRT